MKDNFSDQPQNYANYRPGYPPAFFDYLQTLLPACRNAWDCGTGNGQVAAMLADFFEKVSATDISAQQLEQAPKLPNVDYSVQPAESTSFADQLFDLVIVAQAIHWFDFEKFYREVNRCSVNQGIVCAIGYGRLQISPELDERISHFYHEIIGPYWDKERRYIDEGYQSIPFPFEEIQTPDFINAYRWSLEHLEGYLATWSAVKHYIAAKGHDPVQPFMEALTPLWGHAAEREVNFPLLVRLGRVIK